MFRETNPEEGIIEQIETRKSELKRLAVTITHDSQTIASNIDIVFICMSLNEDFNIKKLQNFLNVTVSKDFKQIILLTKADLCLNIERLTNQIKLISDLETVIVSIFYDESINEVKEIIGNQTCVFIGSSGVGKSTIINKLLNEEHFKTNEIRISDAQGRHTTVHRELVHLDNGGAVIDTPGIRVINAYEINNMETEFEDIFSLSKDCKFRDCTHDQEPGCKVNEAIEDGELGYYRLEAYNKALKINRYTERRELQKQRIIESRNLKRK